MLQNIFIVESVTQGVEGEICGGLKAKEVEQLPVLGRSTGVISVISQTSRLPAAFDSHVCSPKVLGESILQGV